MKTVNVQQAKLNNSYKNTKPKLLKTNAAIWFNKMCKIKQLIPNYITIKTNGQKPQDKRSDFKCFYVKKNVVYVH